MREQARRLRALELEPVATADLPALVTRLEDLGAHPLHHSVIGAWLLPPSLSLLAVKQRYVEEICQQDLDQTSCHLVLSWGAHLVTYLSSLEKGVTRCCRRARSRRRNMPSGGGAGCSSAWPRLGCGS